MAFAAARSASKLPKHLSSSVPHLMKAHADAQTMNVTACWDVVILATDHRQRLRQMALCRSS